MQFIIGSVQPYLDVRIGRFNRRTGRPWARFLSDLPVLEIPQETANIIAANTEAANRDGGWFRFGYGYGCIGALKPNREKGLRRAWSVRESYVPITLHGLEISKFIFGKEFKSVS